MKLFHYKEAKQCGRYIKSMNEKWARPVIMIAQSTYYDRGATLSEIMEAQNILDKFLENIDESE